MIESTNPGQNRVLDEVRAKIFYLASDVEPASPPAAMLLRAVAESIDDAAAELVNGHAALSGMTATAGTAESDALASLRHLAVNGGLPQSVRQLVGSGHKR